MGIRNKDRESETEREGERGAGKREAERESWRFAERKREYIQKLLLASHTHEVGKLE